MLYQSKQRSSLIRIVRRTAGFIAGLMAYLASERADRAYLDGMRENELEDLGLRRSSDGNYRGFK